MVAVELDVPVRMRDGVTLRADVYRPPGGGPFPTLLTRTPYDKGDQRQHVWAGLDPIRAARRGFIVVAQDVRGRFASDGVWESLRLEGRDGYDSVEWAASLPGANGRVGMYGGSYCGNVQWLAAGERPPSLAAIAPALTWSDPLDGLYARGGAVELGLALRWSLENGFDSLRRLPGGHDERCRRVAALIDEWDSLGRAGNWQLPVQGGAVLARHRLPDLGAIRALASRDVIDWCAVAHERVEVPSFQTAGWYDIFLQGTLDNYVAMASRGRAARLIVGPWAHDSFADPIGERLFGMRASRVGVPIHDGGDWSDLQLRWLGAQLTATTATQADQAQPSATTVTQADEPPVMQADQAPVRIFVMGANRWRDEPSWPPARAREQRWFLHSSGALTREPPQAGEQASEYSYDPADPVPTLGGQGVMSIDHATGPAEQAAIERRADVLVFTSAPLSEDLEVTGRVRAVLHAQSSAPSTDWVVRLCDVDRDGRSYNLCDGIVRAAARAQQCTRYDIDLWSTSNVFLRGHRVRVQVTSSSFPRWDRNLNTGDQASARWEIARQRVHHEPERPSYVALPVIAGS